ncbi:MAG: hypothetical protein WD988_01410 [Candidatus Curtissbacteria bacterium]
MRRIILGIAAALVIVVLAAAFLYSRNMMPTQPGTSGQQQTTTESTVNPGGGNTGTLQNKPGWIASLSGLEQSFFAIPAADALDEEKAGFSDLIIKNTQASDQLHIGADCQPTPINYSVENATEVTFKNDDSLGHTITITNNERYVIPANSTATVRIGEDRRAKIAGYGCDQYGLVGFLVIAP